MTGLRKPKRRFRKVVALGTLAGAAFGYRHYRLSKAPEPSWANPS